MKPVLTRVAVAAGVVAVVTCNSAQGASSAAAMPVIYADQGTEWTATRRAEFYRQDQGSQLIKLAWMQALRTPDGLPFLEDGLSRYGYLRDQDTDPLPVGFTTRGQGYDAFVGMTCSACHTREIMVGPQRYRIDGGPALVDFQALLADLDRAVGEVLATNADFDAFARRVLGQGATVGAIAMLRQDVTYWYKRQHSLLSRALPTEPWGLGRLDAVSMIFDRVSGLDIGKTPDGIIESNIMPADAPVRYPFIWDAPKQDKTQWPGFASNGDALLGLARNLGEVYGVFADFRPRKALIGWDFHTVNSADFHGLAHAETLVTKIGAPKWPWAIDQVRRDRGAIVFQAECASCHGVTPGATRLVPPSTTWKTPLIDVGTDQKQYDILAREGETGVLEGALYKLGKHLRAREKQFSILAAAVIGSILDNLLRHGPLPEMFGNPLAGLPRRHVQTVTALKAELGGAYDLQAANKAAMPGAHVYEARVLRGIWSTAPYLHNGSVATLWDLLQSPESRQSAFRVGAAYDPVLVGLAKDQIGLSGNRVTNGCADPRTGNSHCGHDYGTGIPDEKKRDLLEYLKTI